MTVDLFSGIPVRELEPSVDWYRRLLGRDVSFRPDDTEAVWQLGEHVFVYLKTGREVVGGALTAILVDDLDAFLASAAGRGVEPTEIEDYGGGTRKAVFIDPDGNEFGVGTVPAESR